MKNKAEAKNALKEIQNNNIDFFTAGNVNKELIDCINVHDDLSIRVKNGCFLNLKIVHEIKEKKFVFNKPPPPLPLHIDLLQSLRDVGAIGFAADISGFMDYNYTPTDAKPETIGASNKGIKSGLLFIEDLIARKLIYLDDDGNLNKIKNSNIKRFSEIVINVYILSNSLELLDIRYSQQDSFKSNDKIRENIISQGKISSTQTRILGIQIVVLLFSVYFGAVGVALEVFKFIYSYLTK